MNNDLEQFSEERLKEIANEDTLTNMSFEELLALGRIALAVKQAKPVAVFHELAFSEGGEAMAFGLDTAREIGLLSEEGLARNRAYFYTTPQPAHTEQDGWIKCSDRLPEEGGRYWCYVEEQNSLGKSHYQWNCSWNGDCWSDDALSGRVTHWMPLPAAPKPESE